MLAMPRSPHPDGGSRRLSGAKCPGARGRKLTKCGPDKSGAIEVYDRGRFFTVTARCLDEGHATVGDGSAQLAQLHAEWFPPKVVARANPKPRPLKSDHDLVRQIERSQQGAKFREYWGGGWGDKKSKSEADLGLCSILAWWTGGDVGAIDRLFRQSGLFDGDGGKWERISYREPTIDKACNLSTFYDPTRRNSGLVLQVLQPDEQGLDELGPDRLERPEIMILPDEQWVNDQAIRSLASDPRLYCRGQDLVTVRRERRKHRLVNRPDESPWIAVIPRSTLREKMSHVALWMKRRRLPKLEKMEIVPTHPPEWSVAAVADRGDWEGIRHLEGIVEAPSLLADGTILDIPGYDERSGLLYEPNCEFPPIPMQISQEEAKQAAEELLFIVADFPFAAIGDDDGAGHRAAWLAGLLTPFARHAIDGPCPLFLTDANVSGAGKTKLCDIISILTSGRPAARTAFPEHDEEMRKMIISIAVEGDRLMLIDNVATGAALGGASLDGVLTGTTVKGRILGRTEMSREVPIYTVWFATGNNLGIKGDLLRRVVPFRIESPHERPEERTDFRIKGDLIKHVRENRPRLVVAALKILRGYFLAGKPQADLIPMDYPAWCGVVRQAVHWATGIDPCSTRRELIIDNPETHQTKAILTGWAELPNGGNGITAAEALRILQDPDQDLQRRFGTIRDALAEWTRDGKLPSPRTVGNRFKALEGRVVDGMVLRSMSYQGTNKWAALGATTVSDGGSGVLRGSSYPYAGELFPSLVDDSECDRGGTIAQHDGKRPTENPRPTELDGVSPGDAYEDDLPR